MDMYNIIPKQFFGLLSGKNQKLYIACLMEVYKAYEQGSILGLDKTLAKQVIMDYLEAHPLSDRFESDDEEQEEVTYRDLANYVLRRFEESEWIDVDVNNDYDEIINFRDYAITIIEALRDIANDSIYGEEAEGHEFRGYIYTVYSLLTSDHGEYGMVLDQVYKNTSAFVREIRKLDSRMKYYIRTIVDNSEIKDLINLLVNYKIELVDQAYRRLKTSDNINKYRLEIIKTLESYQQDPDIMDVIAKEFLVKTHNNYQLALVRANKRIDDMIDIYNSINYIIEQIDQKNKVYVNSTIAKIKFLLSDDENVISKLSKILRYTATEVKSHKTKRAMTNLEPLFQFANYSQIGNNSLFTPRGFYKRVDTQYLAENNGGPGIRLQEEFYKEFERNYSEDVIYGYLLKFFEQNKQIKASEIIRDDMSDEAVLRLLYILVYAGDELDYYIQPLTSHIEHTKFKLADFEIIRGYDA
ncbi:MAG: hypothetical protein JXB08_04055 [Bacilli bacterium]|nr:hypothetical protein [Bacilli bacterium]MBN2877920.1 hypothetical protein [Bacilli bacterium]